MNFKLAYIFQIKNLIIIIISFLFSFFLRGTFIETRFDLGNHLWLPLVSVFYLIFAKSFIDENKKNIFLNTLVEFLLSVTIIFIFKQKYFSRSFMVLYFSVNLFLSLFLLQYNKKIINLFVRKNFGLENIIVLYEQRFEEGVLAFKKSAEDGGMRVLVEKVTTDNDFEKLKLFDSIVFWGEFQNILIYKKNIKNIITMGKKVSFRLEGSDFGDIYSFEKILGNNFITYKPFEYSLSVKIFKRVLDLFIGSLGVIITLFLFLIFYFKIKKETKKSVLFRQKRLGKNGRVFELYKFRTMTSTDKPLKNELSGPIFKIKDDPRITDFGKILRKTSLDEFPQFFNVLKGDMSLIGPRPPLPSEVEEYEASFYKKMAVKPGITGYWQVNSRNNTWNFEDVLRDDFYYLNNLSISLDLKILLKTIGVMFRGEGR